MTYILFTGSVVPEQQQPTALAYADPQFGVVGSIVKLDGSASTNPMETDLTYTWEFVQVPIGSVVKSEGFKVLEPSGEVVSFSPDVVGEYLVNLTVSNGVYSHTAQIQTSIRAMLVPHGRGIVPDGKFIWSYIRDVWTQVEDREWFETLWSALIQIVGAETLKLYQSDFNKSIRDIQDLYQRRWLSYEPKLNIVTDDCTFYIGNHCAGTDATSTDLGSAGQAIIINTSTLPLPPGELIVTSGSVLRDVVGKTIDVLYDSKQPDNVYSYEIIGTNPAKTGYLVKQVSNPLAGLSHPLYIPDRFEGRVVPDCFPIFSFQSPVWSFGDAPPDYATWLSMSPSPMDFLPPTYPLGGSAILSKVLIGDIIQVKGGPNAGFYRIIEVSPSTVTVHKNPPSSSTGLTSSDIYRPVGFRVEIPDTQVTDTFAIPYEPSTNNPSLVAPGRVVLIAGTAYVVSRTVTDTGSVVPRVLISDNNGEILTGLSGASWRIPHTLVSNSQNFEDLGVASGDRITIDVLDTLTGAVVPIPCQVMGVSGNRLGVIITDEFPTQGEVPEVPLSFYQAISETFGITSVLTDPAGNTVLSGEAKALNDAISTGRFRATYWNKELSPSTDITLNGRSFRIQPRSIIRNRFVPVPDGLVSVPTLQNWIVQPDVTSHDGKYFQLKNGKEYEIESLPVSLMENNDYTINGQTAFYGDLTFNSGTNIVESHVGHFVDRNLRPHDTFTIVSPATLAGNYRIVSVLSNDQLLLATAVPRYVLGEVVTARIRITRKAKGEFLRFLPGGFSAKNPAPARLWAEASLFDNNEAVEGNFGLLVGLTREDVSRISEPVNYRQAVAGLMYAFTQGSSVGRARLGAQILLGLPFSEHRGIIRSIDEDYRVDVHGVPTMGRIFAEDVDPNGVPLGMFRIYTYPLDAESSISGLEVNPATGLPYAVGDVLELFRPLCKGVEILDYLNGDTSDLSGPALVQRLNALRLRANYRIFSDGEMDLVSNFLRKITPAYIGYIVSTMAEFNDDASVRDSEDRRLTMRQVDNASFGIPPAVMFDGKSGWAPYAYWDDGFYWVRKYGRDLVTTYDNSVPVVTGTVGGGAVTPPFGEGPVCKATDSLVILDGPNTGTYPITSLTDTSLTVSGLPVSGFQAATQGYMVLRKISSLIRSGTGTYTNASTTVSLGAGLVADGVGPGDTLIIMDPGAAVYYRRTILRVGGTTSADGYSPALVAGEAQVDSLLPSNGAAQPYSIFRLSLNAPEGAGLTATAAPVIFGGDSNITISDKLFLALLDTGDTLVDTVSPSGNRYTVLDPFKVYVTPPLPASTTVRLEKRGMGGSAITYDQLRNDPQDEVKSMLRETDTGAAQCLGTDVTLRSWNGAAYTVLDTTLFVIPGDYLHLLNGGNSTVDIGCGPGVYPVVSVQAAGAVRLARTLTANDTSAWELIRRR